MPPCSTICAEFIVSSADRDFPFKLMAKRLAWSHGYIPLLNVPVQMPPTAARRSRSDLTDADVLGFRFSADGPVDRFLADCKATTGKATDRVLWVKGLSAYLGITNTYLLKSEIAENARWLALQLGIVPMSELEQSELSDRLVLSFKGPYFDQVGYEALSRLRTSFIRGTRYHEVASFLNFTIWSLPPAVRVLSLLDLLNPEAVFKTFNPDDHQHQALVLLGAFQFGLALALTISSLVVADLPILERRLRETLHDGPIAFEQKLKYMKEFNKIQGLNFRDDEAALDLHSFPNLLELVGRLIVRRNHLNDALRLIDIATYYHAAKQSYPHSPRWLLEPYTQKMSVDILELFVRSNHLDPAFMGLLNFPSSPPAQTQLAPANDGNGVGHVGGEAQAAEIKTADPNAIIPPTSVEKCDSTAKAKDAPHGAGDLSEPKPLGSDEHR
jgi:hypothetical protein